MIGKYAVQCGYFSGEIYAGALNKDRTAFTSKDDVTGQVFHAIADWVQHHHEDGVVVTLPDGRRVEIAVHQQTDMEEGDE